MEQYNELLRILGQFTQHDLKMDESIAVSSIIDKLPSSWKDFKHTLKHKKEELTLVQLGSHFMIEESLRAQEIDKVNDKNVAGSSSVNMVEESGTVKQNYNAKGNKRKFQGNKNKGPNKQTKLSCWKCGKPGHLKRDCRVFKGKNKAGPSGSNDPEKQQGQIVVNNFNSNTNSNYVSLISDAFYVQDDDVAWWFDSGATSHVCKDRRWFKEFRPIDDGSIVKMGNVATEPILGLGCVNLVFTSEKKFVFG